MAHVSGAGKSQQGCLGKAGRSEKRQDAKERRNLQSCSSRRIWQCCDNSRGSGRAF